MTFKLDWKRALGLGIAMAAIVATTAFAVPQLTQAAPTDAVAYNGRGPGIGAGPDDTYLADALGITTDELSAAEQKAYEAAIQEAVDKGLITEAQATQLRNGTGRRGAPLFFWNSSDIDQKALLADALGITTTQLDAAQQKAADARLAQAVTDGRITQDQADLMKAEQALQQYIQDNDVFGKTVAAAVADGAITQAQADAILAARSNTNDLKGFSRFGDFDGERGGHPMMQGGMVPGGRAPAQPQAPAMGSSF
jgi:hypothetical protein